MDDNKLVCISCGVYCRKECETRDETGEIVCSRCVCAYCGEPALIGRRHWMKP
jgi:hypothetical protein